MVKKFIFFILLLMASIDLSAQMVVNYDDFIRIFRKELRKYPIGKYENHFNEKFIVATSDNVYFEKNKKINLSPLYQNCVKKDRIRSAEQILLFFENAKREKKAKEELTIRLSKFDYVQSVLKVMILSDQYRSVYTSGNSIIKDNNPGMIEVVMLDIPEGIQPLNKKELQKWGKTEEEIFNLAKYNSITYNKKKFSKPDKYSKDKYSFLIDTTDVFVTSVFQDLRDTEIPKGKFGTLVAIPNNSVLVARSLTTKEEVNLSSFKFMDYINHMANDKLRKSISNNIFWYYENSLYIVKKDYYRQRLILPEKLQELLK